jgi:hypothetical protein
MVMRLPSGELVVPTGADTVRVSVDALTACQEAASLLRQAGFQLAYASMRSEACYYQYTGYHGAIRIAAHRLGRTESQGVGMPVVAKITFGANQGPVRFENIEQQVMLALGRYFFTRLQHKVLTEI